MALPPDDVSYAIVDGPEWEDVRAGCVAHAIRLGKRPPIGVSLGFAFQIKKHESETAEPDLSKIDLDDPTVAVPVSEKVWCSFSVIQEDIDNAIQLINGQKITYREPKVSQMKLEDLAKKFSSR